MRRSRQLVQGHWWRVFGALIVGYLIVGVLQGMLGALLGGVVLVHSDSQLLNAVVLTAVNIVALAVTLPFAVGRVTLIVASVRSTALGTWTVTSTCRASAAAWPAKAARSAAGSAEMTMLEVVCSAMASCPSLDGELPVRG